MDNRENPQKFGLPQKEKVYQKYTNRYYILHYIGANERDFGKIKNIDVKHGKITLNPYFGLSYNKAHKRNLYDLINEDCDAFIDLSKITFEPTTKKVILSNCDANNKEILKNELKPKSFFEKLKLSYKILTS